MAARFRRRYACCFAAFLVSLAGAVSADEVWLNSTTIYAIYPLATGTVVLTFEADATECTSGSSPKYYTLKVGANNVTADGFENVLATALAAAATRAIVSVAFDDSTSDCYINRIWVDFR